MKPGKEIKGTGDPTKIFDLSVHITGKNTKKTQEIWGDYTESEFLRPIVSTDERTQNIIDHIIREWIKLAQKKYKNKNFWVNKVIHWELSKKLKFHHSDEW